MHFYPIKTIMCKNEGVIKFGLKWLEVVNKIKKFKMNDD